MVVIENVVLWRNLLDMQHVLLINNYRVLAQSRRSTIMNLGGYVLRIVLF